MRKRDSAPDLKFCLKILLTFGLTISLILLSSAGTYGQDQVSLEKPLFKCWEKKLDNDYTVASDNDSRIFLTSADGVLRAIDASDRNESWQFFIGGKLVRRPVADQSSTYLISQIDGTDLQTTFVLRSVNNLTGVTNWQAELSGLRDPFLIENNGAIVLLDDSGVLSFLNKATGKLSGRKSLGRRLSTPPAFGSGGIALAGPDKILLVGLKQDDADRTINVKGGVTALLYAGKNSIFWGDGKGNLFGWDAGENRRLWKIRVGGRISSLQEYDDGILAASFDNFLYYFSKTNGNLIWKKRVSGRIVEKPYVWGGYAVVTGVGDETAAVLSIDSGRTVNLVSLESGDYFAGTPFVVRDMIVFPTSSGLVGYTNKDCSKKQKSPIEN